MKFISTLSVLSLILCRVAVGQDVQRVQVSNNDPKWGETITVSYSAPDSVRPDTIYCSTDFLGESYLPALVQPMSKLGPTNYEAHVTIPAGTYEVWLEIVTPVDRMPDGINIFTCRTDKNVPTPGATLGANDNVDSAIEVELARYPRHYSVLSNAYDKMRQMEMMGELKKDRDAWRAILSKQIEWLDAHPDTSLNWYLTAASLNLRRSNDSGARSYLMKAAGVHAFDPILNDRDFWNHFFAPVQKADGRIAFEYDEGRMLSPLAARFPQTHFSHAWLERQAYDSLLPVSIYSVVLDRYRSSHDVDLLLAISDAFNGRAMHNTDSAMMWLSKAEADWYSHKGFYTGENIYGSMGRLDGIITRKIKLLGVLGRVAEAEEAAFAIMKMQGYTDRKRDVQAALARMYLDVGDLTKAKRAYAQALSMSTRTDIGGLDKLYEKTRQRDETLEAFRQRLLREYPPVSALPPVPDFTYTTLSGKKGRLADLRGKVVVLDCWFISCPGCAIEKQSLNDLANSYRTDTNIVFLSIALDGRQALESYQARTPFAFDIVADGQDICDRLGVTGYPTHILIGRNGETLGYEEGGNEQEGNLMRPKIELALRESTHP